MTFFRETELVVTCILKCSTFTDFEERQQHESAVQEADMHVAIAELGKSLLAQKKQKTAVSAIDVESVNRGQRVQVS
jgi:hypothetical protein